VNNEVSKVLFIINRFAGKGYHEDLEGVIIDQCKKHKVEFKLSYTQSRGHATTLAKEAVNEKIYSVVVAVGGDGTVNEVAQGLLHGNVPMGIVPKGSGNGLARHLKIPMNFVPAIDNIFTSRVISMDTFLLNERLSLNVSGIGFDGHIANIFGSEKKRGLQGYVKHTIKELISFKEFDAVIDLGANFEKRKRKAFVIAIANSSQYGNNARIAPAASVSDQLLHVCVLRKVPAYRIDFIYNFFRGKIENSSFCEFITSKEFSISLDKPMAYHVDGEPGGQNNFFTIKILPESLKILVPEKTRYP
jgi:diacylglycerol kinase (ATP)